MLNLKPAPGVVGPFVGLDVPWLLKLPRRAAIIRS
jgi:hypothetical protein